jgi:hypothetical protein
MTKKGEESITDVGKELVIEKEQQAKGALTRALDLARVVVGDEAAVALMQEAIKQKIRGESHLLRMIGAGVAGERSIVERYRARLKYVFAKKRRTDEDAAKLIVALNDIINQLP